MRGVIMASVYTFKDGKLIHKDKIAYANGDFVSLKDYEALENKAQKLKCELDKTYNQLMEVEKDAQERITELKSELEVKDNLLKIKNGLNESSNFETDRLVILPFDALETANMLINATYKDEIPILERQVDRDLYDIDDLEQIAEHLLVYCKHNRKDEE